MIARSSSAASSSPVAERMGAGLAGAVGIGRRDVSESAEPVLVRLPERLAAGQIQRAERVAVVAAPARDHDPAVGLAAGEVIGPGELQRRLDRLRAAADRVDRGVVDRQVRRRSPRHRLERLGGERRAVGVGEAELLPEDPGDRRAPVTDVDDDRAAGGVEVLPAVGVPDR